MAKFYLYATLIQGLFIGLNALTGVYQAHRFDSNRKTISHTKWAIAYGCVVALASIPWFNWWLISALIAQRLPFFNTVLNFSRRVPRSIFYTHPVWIDKRGNSWLDRLWGNWYPVVFFLFLAILITLQFFIYG